MKYLYIIILLFLVIVLLPDRVKAQDDYLPKTVIFKVKEVHREVCVGEYININEIERLNELIRIEKLTKLFPGRIKERDPNKIDLSMIYKLTYGNNLSVPRVIEQLRKFKIAEYVEPYYLPKLCYTPSDTLFTNQYYVSIINAPSAWDINQGDTTIVIGVTDTGWDPNHPDLLGNVKINYNDPINGNDDDNDGYLDNYLGWDLGMDDNDATWQSTAHGVNVTGIAAAVTDNVTGISGVGFNTKFLPIKISNSAGLLTHAYQGVVYAADHGCSIINCSWGSYSRSQFNQDIIDYAIVNKGCIVVGAVGNDNGENIFYPAGYKGVLSVAATEQSDFKKNNSNFGYYVDISAPGEAMWTTGSNSGYSLNGGTSMAAPVISGGAAILKSQFPNYTSEQIIALMRTTAADLNTLNPSFVDKLGSGRLDLFAGVSSTSHQFLGLSSWSTTDNNDNIFGFGDTLLIEALFTNYLDPISAFTVTLSSSSPYVSIIDGVTNLPAMSTLSSISNSSDLFTVEVLTGAPFNEEVTFKLEITNGSFSINEYFTVIINPDYIHLEENLVATTITSNGKIGFNDASNSVGLGFTYKGEQLLFEAGLMIGDDTSRVADVVRGVTSQDQDFFSLQNVGFNPPYVSALDLYNKLDDSPLTNPLNVTIDQFSYAYSNAPDDKFIILVYDLENIGISPLSNLHAGIFADWDIGNSAVNKSGYDATRKMGYVHSLSSDTLYAAIKVLSSDLTNNYSLDLDGSGGINIGAGGFSSSEKYTTLSTSRNSSGGLLGNDVAHVVSIDEFSLNPNEKKRIAFAILAGDSLQDIQTSADAAQLRFDNDGLTIQENNEDIDLSVYPNPTKSVIYISSTDKIDRIFLKDVLGRPIETYHSKKVDLSNHPNGIYILEVIFENTRIAKKVILSH